MMKLETTCHMSCVTCHLSLINLSQTVKTRDLQFSNIINYTLCVMCPISHFRCHMSLVMCHVFRVKILNVFFVVGVCLFRLSYQQGLPRLSKKKYIFIYLIKSVLIPNIYFSLLVVVCFTSLKKTKN